MTRPDPATLLLRYANQQTIGRQQRQIAAGDAGIGGAELQAPHARVEGVRVQDEEVRTLHPHGETGGA